MSNENDSKLPRFFFVVSIFLAICMVLLAMLFLSPSLWASANGEVVGYKEVCGGEESNCQDVSIIRFQDARGQWHKTSGGTGRVCYLSILPLIAIGSEQSCNGDIGLGVIFASLGFIFSLLGVVSLAVPVLTKKKPKLVAAIQENESAVGILVLCIMAMCILVFIFVGNVLASGKIFPGFVYILMIVLVLFGIPIGLILRKIWKATK